MNGYIVKCLGYLLPTIAGIVALAAPVTRVTAQTAAEPDRIEEIVVTSRRRQEPMQDVPDSVTAFSSAEIEAAGIDDVFDFVQLTPNITMREAFRAGVTFITIRGITTGQQGWPPVTYVVDGVPAGSLDAINHGALVEIERIEVLKGPQSALYGAGAIAGAINVVTKSPTEEYEAGGRISWANGNDLKTVASVSGPLFDDEVLFKVDAYYRDANGIIESTDGEELDFEEHASLRARLLSRFGPVDVDLRGHYAEIEAGAAFQELLPPGDAGLALLDDFDRSPGIQRGIIGTEDRRIAEVSLKVDWELDFGTITSITGYSDLDQELFGTTSWNKPPAVSFCGPVGGPGQPPDCFQRLGDDFEVISQDLRITSNSDQRIRWLFGVSYLDREVINLLRVGNAAIGPGGHVTEGADPFLNRVDARHDRFRSVYGQVNIDISEELELTLAARYDENDFDTTQYQSLQRITPVPVLTLDGLVVTQEEIDDKFQPKAQISYDWRDTLMTYASIARGFRTGFFNSGNLTAEETTWNYEVGAKSEWFDHRLRANLAIFHIDYSNQQFSRIVPPPEIRAVENIPQTDINGLELEILARPTQQLTVSAGLGVTDAEVKDGTDAPFTPEYTVNISAEHQQPIMNSSKDLVARIDYRYQSPQFLERDEMFRISGKQYVNARLSLKDERWRLTAFGENLTDERQANEVNQFPFGFIRVPNRPRSYGVEVSVNF